MPVEEVNAEDSILTSVKKLLGLTEENEEFDIDITIMINSAIFILAQIGVGPEDGYVVSDKTNTYEDWLGDAPYISMVKTYLYYKVRLSFDPPTQSAVLDSLKGLITEMESRLSYQVDPGNKEELQNG